VVPFFVGRLASSIASLAGVGGSRRSHFDRWGIFFQHCCAAGGRAPFGRILIGRGIFFQHCCAAGAFLTGLPAAPLCGASRLPFEGHYPSDHAPLSRG
jgi:hypothetical protein